MVTLMNSLKLVLRMNAISCIVFGLFGLMIPASISVFLGDPPVGFVQVVGVVLVANGLHLIWASRRKTMNKWEIFYFSFGDLAWWLGSIFLIAAQIWVTTTLGVIAMLVIAFAVAIMGVTQLWQLAIHTKQRSRAEQWTAIKHSYWSMPKWVFVWLCFLNVYFLMSIWFWPDRLSVVILLGYVATGPLLAAQIAFDGGLRRILGLAHLIPWIPLLIWLTTQSEGHLYVSVLIILLVVCLAFDVYDVWRFWRGDRNTLGQPKWQLEKVNA